ncbi:MAG: hypothetical protein LC808_08120 [Actinobacteria bacterium]|nr:hypothetical protein [Actinomycetota bacterium]
MDDEETARTIGWKVQRMRDARGKPLRVIAGRAGMSTSTLHVMQWRVRAVVVTGRAVVGASCHRQIPGHRPQKIPGGPQYRGCLSAGLGRAATPTVRCAASRLLRGT